MLHLPAHNPKTKISSPPRHRWKRSPHPPPRHPHPTINHRAFAPSVIVPAASPTPRLIAVNLPPEEPRILPLAPEKLPEFGVRLESTSALDPASPTAPEDRERLATTEQEGRQRAWLWLLTAILLILALETWLSGRIRQPTPQPTYS